MQEFTEEYKKIQKGLHLCWGERASKNDELTRLKETRRKTFGDIALGLVSPSKKEILNKKIKELEEDIFNADIAVSELELREVRIKMTGGHMQEKVEV